MMHKALPKFLSLKKNESKNSDIWVTPTDYSNNTTPVSREEIKSNLIFLIVYMLSMAVFVVIYYLKTNNMVDIQNFLVLLGTGLTNVLTGVILFYVKQTKEFLQIDGLLILIQPLMGLKGNLEMTMASRMCTMMNIREDMVSCSVVCKEISDDIILVITQAIVVSLVTALFAVVGLALESFNGYNIINLCAISLLTAFIACFLLGETFLLSFFPESIENHFYSKLRNCHILDYCVNEKIR